MPLLGFLGFPPFAVECYVIYSFLSLFRYGRGWEQDSYELHDERKTSRRFRLITTLFLVLFYIISTRAIDRYTVDSTLPILDDFPALTANEREQLEGLGITTMDDLSYKSRTPEGYKRILGRLNFSPDRLDELVRQARLIGLKGLGIDHFLLLQEAGIDSVEELAKEDLEGMTEKLRNATSSHTKARQPTRPQIKLWIMEARRQSR
jgi:hypothetical protein